jgi:hypothetical protein
VAVHFSVEDLPGAIVDDPVVKTMSGFWAPHNKAEQISNMRESSTFFKICQPNWYIQGDLFSKAREARQYSTLRGPGLHDLLHDEILNGGAAFTITCHMAVESQRSGFRRDVIPDGQCVNSHLTGLRGHPEILQISPQQK